MLHKAPTANTDTKTEKILKIIIVVLCLAYLCITLIFKPIISNDALNGMVSLHNYLNGSAWNKSFTLSGDFSRIVSNELTWWSPGQYVLPYLLSKALSINIGTAITILIYSALFGGCYFYYRVLKLSGIDKRIVLSALIILLLQRFMTIFFIQYYSSDIFLFFYAPFYAFVYYKLLKNYQRQTVLKLILLTLLNWGGLFIKNSFLLFELAVNGFLVIEYLFNSRIADKKSILNTDDIAIWKRLTIPLAFVLANLANYYFFLRLGYNASDGAGLLFSLNNILMGICLPIVQTLFSSLSIYSFHGNFYDKVNLSDNVVNVVMVVTLLIIAYIVYKKRDSLLNLFKSNIFFRFVTIAAIINIGIWFIFTLKQSYVLNEDRLYMPISILVLPFLLSFALKSRSILKYAYFAAIGCSVLYGMVSFVNRTKQYAINGSVWSNNKNLNGFKVFSTSKNNDPDLQKVTDVINTNYSSSYIVLIDNSLVFQLNVPNKFIAIPVLPVKMADDNKPSPNYIVLVNVGKDKPPVGLRKVYSSAKWEIYKPD